MSRNTTNETHGCIVATIGIVILAGILIYTCIYLTQYHPKNSTTLSANYTMSSTKMIKLPTSSVQRTADESDDDDTSTYASVPNLIKIEVPVLKKATFPTLTQVVIPRKPIKKVTHHPEEFMLQNVKG